MIIQRTDISPCNIFLSVIICFCFYSNDAAIRKLDQKNMNIKHRVLVLGAGHVASPLIEYLTRDKSVKITTGKCYYQISFKGT